MEAWGNLLRQNVTVFVEEKYRNEAFRRSGETCHLWRGSAVDETGNPSRNGKEWRTCSTSLYPLTKGVS